MSDTERIDAEEYSAKADEDTATEAEVLAHEPNSEDTVGESDIVLIYYTAIKKIAKKRMHLTKLKKLS